jgi:hypothetical protein
MKELKEVQKKYENLIKKIKYLNELIWKLLFFKNVEFPKKIHPNTMK